MRLISENQGFWSCNNDHQKPFLIPFGIVDTTNSDPSDNYLHIQYIGSPASLVQVKDYETDIDLLANILFSVKFAEIDGVMREIRLIRIDMASLPLSTTCAYVRIGVGAIPFDPFDVAFFRTEAVKIYRFDELTPKLVRLESQYSRFDCLMHDIEGIDRGGFFPVETSPNYYDGGIDNSRFRNFQWFEGDISFSDSKQTKSYEGFFNRHVKTRFVESYELFLRGMPDWYAKELTNVLGGRNIEVFNNSRRVKHSFTCTESNLSKDRRSCLVLPTGVKLQSVDKTILLGCD